MSPRRGVLLNQQRYQQVQNLLDRAYDDRLKGTISDEMWARRSREWELELSTLRTDLERREAASSQYMIAGAQVLELARGAKALFLRQEPAEQRRLLETLGYRHGRPGVDHARGDRRHDVTGEARDGVWRLQSGVRRRLVQWQRVDGVDVFAFDCRSDGVLGGRSTLGDSVLRVITERDPLGAPAPFGFSVIDFTRCMACDGCARVCPTGAIHTASAGADREIVTVSHAACIQCRACVTECPEQAVSVSDSVEVAAYTRQQLARSASSPSIQPRDVARSCSWKRAKALLFRNPPLVSASGSAVD
jgi:ferredoxin